MNKRIASITVFVATIAFNVFSASVLKDSGYINTIVLENFSKSSAPPADYNNSYFNSANNSLAIYKYKANGKIEGYISFDTPDFDPAKYRYIRTRFYVNRIGGTDMAQVYAHPYGSSTRKSIKVLSGTTLREYGFDFSSSPIDGRKVRLDPWNYTNDSVEDILAIDYWMVDRGPTKGIEWDHDGDDQGIGTLLINDIMVKNGILSGTGNGDAQLSLLRALGVSDGDADIYKYIEIRIKNNGDRIDLFWSTKANSSALKKVIVENGSPSNTGWHTYIVDMTGEVKWTGTINELRLDPVRTDNTHFELDYVRLLSAAPSANSDSGSLLAANNVALPSISHGPMLGAVSATNAKVWVRSTIPSDVIFSLRETDSGSNFTPRVIYASAESDNTCIVNFDHLTPDTKYQYCVSIGTNHHQRTFTTLGKSLTNRSIRLVYGYGYEPKEDTMPPGTSIFMNMSKRNAGLVIFIGDFPYTLHGGRQELLKGNKELRSIVGFRALTDSTPTYGIYDDHDFGPNDCDGTHPNADVALRTFKQYWANPSYGLPTDKGIYSSFVMGEIEFFLLDGRYNARKKEKTMLGKAQFNWLCAGLENSKSRLKVLVSGTQFGRVKEDGWPGKHYIEERTKLFNFIRDHHISGVFGISGDVHRNDIYKLPIGGNRFFYDFTPGSLARHHRPTPANFPSGLIYSCGAGAKDNQFGEIEFFPESNTNTVIIFRNFSPRGMTYEYALSFADLDAEGDELQHGK